MAAFDIASDDDKFIDVQYLYEGVFGLAVLLSFLSEKVDENTHEPVDNLSEIAKIYIGSEFGIDIFSLMPFHLFFYGLKP